MVVYMFNRPVQKMLRRGQIDTKKNPGLYTIIAHKRADDLDQFHCMYED